MGSIDRIIRVILAIVLGVLYYTNLIGGTFGLILVVVAAVFLLTSFVSFCPLYTLLGINTCEVKQSKGAK